MHKLHQTSLRVGYHAITVGADEGGKETEKNKKSANDPNNFYDIKIWINTKLFGYIGSLGEKKMPFRLQDYGIRKCTRRKGMHQQNVMVTGL